MTPHEFLDDDLREQAALYVLGSLAPDDERVWRLHLGDCAPCRAEVDSLARTSRELLQLVPEETPPPALFDRVLERVRSGPPRASDAGGTQVWKGWSAARPSADGMEYVPHDPAAFEPTAIDGIEVRKLSVDRANDRVTMLVRMAAGTAYPGHRHGGVEECFVLAGDLHVGDLHMHAGDYQRMSGATRHGVQRTDEGCTLLIVSSLSDEIGG